MIITAANKKGGVSKSSTIWAIGQVLQKHGKKVLYADLDSQANLTMAFGAKMKGANIFGVLLEQVDIENAIQHTEIGDIIAATPALNGANATFTETGREHHLRKSLEPLASQYDYILIDTPPELGVLTVNALTAAQKVIIPTQADLFAYEGVRSLYRAISQVQEYANHDLSIAGILLTRYNSRVNINKSVRESLENLADKMGTKVFETTIRECVAIREAQLLRKGLYDYASDSNAVVDYEALVKEAGLNG